MSKKGFTLIELMIVIAIIAIIAAIAIPNLLASRIQANETNAIAALREFVAAQGQYQKGHFGQFTPATGPNSYAYPYWALYSDGDAPATPQTVRLISATFAWAAEANPPTAGTAVGQVPGAASPFQGYQFLDDAVAPGIIAPGGTSVTAFGLIGAPATYRSTGYNTFWVGMEGVVFQSNSGAAQNCAAVQGAINHPTQVFPSTTLAGWVQA